MRVWQIFKHNEKDYERCLPERQKVAAILGRAGEMLKEALDISDQGRNWMSKAETMMKDAFSLSEQGLFLQQKTIVPFCYDLARIDGNLGLNEGIGVLLTLLIGTGGTVFSNANAYTGVGDSSTAASATQTGLQAATNKLYKAMDTSYSSISAQTCTWQSTYQSADANFAWNEFTVANGSSDASTNLNRKVSSQGTKASGQVWTLQIAVTQS